MREMEDNEFDLAIVDPPYGIGDVRQMSKKRKRLHGGFDWNDKIPDEEYFNELKRVAKNQIVWGINYYTKHISDCGRIVHNKVGAGANQLLELSDCDLASHSFGKNIKMFTYVWRGNVQGNTVNWKNTGPDARIHPTQKPIALYKWLLKNYAKEGDKILDTHAGSMSSVIASIEMGHPITAYEIDKDYFNAGKKRVLNYFNQGNMFREGVDIQFIDTQTD